VQIPAPPGCRAVGRAGGAMLEDHHRQLDHAALEHRKTAYRIAGVTVRYGEQSGDLGTVKNVPPAANERDGAGQTEKSPMTSW
jgi:hypothetical protein